MRTSKNNLTEKEMELVSLIMQDCQSTGYIQSRLKRLFAGTIEQMLEAEMQEHLGYVYAYCIPSYNILDSTIELSKFLTSLKEYFP